MIVVAYVRINYLFSVFVRHARGGSRYFMIHAVCKEAKSFNPSPLLEGKSQNLPTFFLLSISGNGVEWSHL